MRSQKRKIEATDAAVKRARKSLHRFSKIRGKSANGKATPTSLSREHRAGYHDGAVSGLLDLPTELLQSIFIMSGNCDLPLASQTLMKQLSGPQLYRAIIDVALAPFVPEPGSHEIEGDIDTSAARRVDSDMAVAARSVLSRRFFSWTLFAAFLHDTFLPSGNAIEHDGIIGTKAHSNSKQYWFSVDRRLEEDVSHSQAITPASRRAFAAFLNSFLDHAHFPANFLRGPWTDSKCSFLEFYVVITADAESGSSLPSSSGENQLFDTGFQNAVSSGSYRATRIFHALGAPVHQTALRYAVDYAFGADNIFSFLVYEELVSALASLTLIGQFPQTSDYLDPVLWQWTAKAPQARDGRGTYVLKQLKAAQASMSSFASRKANNSLAEMFRPTYSQWIEGKHFK